MNDDKFRETLENFSNGVSRRTFLEKAVKGFLATATALALGQLNLQPAFAATIHCCQGNPCGGPDPCNSCASLGKILCKSTDCPSYCPHASGCWTCVEQSTGLTYNCCDCRNSNSCSSPLPCVCPSVVHCCAPN
jgi:hypothetical protein